MVHYSPSNGEPLDLGELSEIADADTTGWIAVDRAHDLCRGQIVAVELLTIQTELLGKIGRGADRDHLAQILERLCDLQIDAAPTQPPPPPGLRSGAATSSQSGADG